MNWHKSMRVHEINLPVWNRHVYRNLHLPAIFIAGCCVLVSVTLSLLLIFQHLRWYTKPLEQKWIVAIVFMVPVYATESIISLWDTKLSVACSILRSCYEAFALYSFGSYLVACLGGEAVTVNFLEDKAQKQVGKPFLESNKDPQLEKKTFRNFILRPHLLGKDLFIIIKFGLVQYMIMKSLSAFLAFALEIFGVYGDGQFKWNYGYPYITVVLNFSQMWALYCLIKFYNATHQRLQLIRPLAKFISFKAIVFATWWQGVGIVLLCNFSVLPKQRKLQTGLQDFLICIEMAVAAVAHIFVFSAKPYHFIQAPNCGYVTTPEPAAAIKIEDGDQEKPALVETKDTEIESPGTSIKESVHDIVVEGGHKIVKDVVLTINQAIEPVHEGMTKIQENFQHRKDEPEVKIEHEPSENREAEV